MCVFSVSNVSFKRLCYSYLRQVTGHIPKYNSTKLCSSSIRLKSAKNRPWVSCRCCVVSRGAIVQSCYALRYVMLRAVVELRCCRDAPLLLLLLLLLLAVLMLTCVDTLAV